MREYGLILPFNCVVNGRGADHLVSVDIDTPFQVTGIHFVSGAGLEWTDFRANKREDGEGDGVSFFANAKMSEGVGVQPGLNLIFPDPLESPYRHLVMSFECSKSRRVVTSGVIYLRQAERGGDMTLESTATSIPKG